MDITRPKASASEVAAIWNGQPTDGQQRTEQQDGGMRADGCGSIHCIVYRRCTVAVFD